MRAAQGLNTPFCKQILREHHRRERNNIMADTEWKAGAKNVIGYLKELRKLTADADGAHRVAWTPTWDKAQA